MGCGASSIETINKYDSRRLKVSCNCNEKLNEANSRISVYKELLNILTKFDSDIENCLNDKDIKLTSLQIYEHIINSEHNTYDLKAIKSAVMYYKYKLILDRKLFLINEDSFDSISMFLTLTNKDKISNLKSILFSLFNSKLDSICIKDNEVSEDNLLLMEGFTSSLKYHESLNNIGLFINKRILEDSNLTNIITSFPCCNSNLLSLSVVIDNMSTSATPFLIKLFDSFSNSNLLNITIALRCSIESTSLGEKLINTTVNLNLTSLILNGLYFKEPFLSKLLQSIIRTQPKLKIFGIQNKFFSVKESFTICKLISKSQEIDFILIGIPKSEIYDGLEAELEALAVAAKKRTIIVDYFDIF